MKINEADVAELVDARDLKSVGPFDFVEVGCKTQPHRTRETGEKPADLQNTFSPPTIRKSLDALRAKHGADTPIGHRCSNLIEQLKNYERGTGDRWAIQQNMAKSLADLARLSSGEPHDAEECGCQP